MYADGNEKESSRLVEIKEESQKMEHWRIKPTIKLKHM